MIRLVVGLVLVTGLVAGRALEDSGTIDDSAAVNGSEVCCSEPNIDIFKKRTFLAPQSDFNFKNARGRKFVVHIANDCPEKQLLSGFQHQAYGDHKFGFSYECTDINQELAHEVVTTPWTENLGKMFKIGENASHDFPRVDCSDKGFLASAHTELDMGTLQVRYSFSCRRPAGSNALDSVKCEERTSTKMEIQIINKSEMQSLGQLHVRCGAKEVLKGFMGKTTFEGLSSHNWFTYTCCLLEPDQTDASLP